jgi:hypothetical protein
LPFRNDFSQRQKYYQWKSHQNEDKIIQQENDKLSSYFQPNIHQSKSLSILKEKKPEIYHETIDEKIERLSKEDIELRKRKKQLLEKKYYSSYQLPFSPEINYISKLFGKKSSFEELYENVNGKAIKENIKNKLENEITEECTFHPKINEKSRILADPDYSHPGKGGNDGEDDYEKIFNEYYRTVGYAEGKRQDEQATGEEGKGGGGRVRSQSPSSSSSVCSSAHSKLGRINLSQPERMFYEIQQSQLEKEQKRKDEIIAKEIKELQNCTFQPMLKQNSSFLSQKQYYQRQSNEEEQKPIIIKGFNRHLELKAMSEQLKREEQEREYNAFHVKNIDKFRRQEDGSTIVKVSDLTFFCYFFSVTYLFSCSNSHLI